MWNNLQVRIPVLALSLLALAALVSLGVGAVIPMSINYQGRLLDSAGKPVPNGTHDFVFRFYDAETGGNLLWSEEHLDVPVNDGLFQVNLGTINEITPDVVTPPSSPIESFFDIFLEVTTDGEVMEPRTPLSSTPYAMMTHRVDGDITTAPGSLSIINQIGFNYEKIKWDVGGGESYGEMEASDGFTVTKAYDKATPNLFQSYMESGDGVSMTKAYDKSSPLLYETYSEASDGVGLTKRIDKSSPLLYELTIESSDLSAQSARIDKASPQLYQALVQSEEGPSITKRIDQASPLLYESTVESTDGLSLTKEYDKATPILFQSSMESGEGPSITKRIDKASPLLYESTVESTDGLSLTKEYDKASPKLAMFGAHYMDIEDVDVGDSVSFTMVADTAGASMRQAIQAGDAALQAQLNTSILPTEEVSLRMTSSGGTLPIEEICVSTGPGSDPVSMWMFTTSSLMPGAGPADTNFQVYVTAEGGTLEMENVGGTSGDGVAITITDDDNSLRIRHGGANTGVYLESDPSTGGRIGINNEAPSEALQVSGNICASGAIGACSDVRFKDNIEDITGALDKVTSLRGVSFTWKQDEYPAQRFADGRQVGLIAQEVLEVTPEVVLKDGDGYYSVDYGKLTPLLVEAVKELKAQNAELRRRIEVLEKTGQ
jgi:type VI protein secretion system component Hcp